MALQEGAVILSLKAGITKREDHSQSAGVYHFKNNRCAYGKRIYESENSDSMIAFSGGNSWVTTSKKIQT